MATTTPNLGLSKPEVTDKLVDSLAGFNGNADKLDEAIAGLEDALNGKQPEGDYLTQDNLQSATDAALAQAKASGEFDGTDGKTAYAYAVDGGYTGTEAEFAEKLAQEQLTGTTNDITPTQVYNAVSAGIPVKVQYFDETFGTLSYTNFSIAENMNMIAANCIVMVYGAYMLGELLGDITNNIWSFITTTLAEKADIPDIPTALPNPNALTIKIGGTTVTYDGSAEKTVTIADGSEVAY